MSRLLAGAAAILAGIVVPAAAALALPRSEAARAGITLPTVTVPTVPVPTVSTPTVTVPRVTTPAVTTPSVTVPTVRTPTVPATTVPAYATPPSAPAGRQATGGPTAQGSGRSGSGGFVPQSAPAGSSGTQRMGEQSRRQRPRITHFRLAEGGLVRVAAWQLAPHCRFVGLFTLRARRGANLLRLPRRIDGHRLRVGTYHFVGTSRGTPVLDVRFRLVRGKQQLRVRRNHLVDACSAVVPFTTTALAAGLPFAAGGSPPPPAASPSTAGHSIEKSEPGFLPPVLHDLNPANASPLVRAIVFALLGGAIALLAAASLTGRAGAAAAGGVFLARHRMPITLGGFALLVVAALLMLHL